MANRETALECVGVRSVTWVHLWGEGILEDRRWGVGLGPFPKKETGKTPSKHTTKTRPALREHPNKTEQEEKDEAVELAVKGWKTALLGERWRQEIGKPIALPRAFVYPMTHW